MGRPKKGVKKADSLKKSTANSGKKTKNDAPKS